MEHFIVKTPISYDYEHGTEITCSCGKLSVKVFSEDDTSEDMVIRDHKIDVLLEKSGIKFEVID